MAPSLKLYYFDMSGRAEPIRILLACAQIPYEDYRFPREDWPKLKEEMPYGQVPVLEINGKKIAQSTAICRYIATLGKLAGENDVENLEIDAIVDTFADVQKKIMDVRMEKDETKKDDLKKKLVGETIPYFFKRWDDKAAENGGYIATKKLTWADVRFISFYESARGAVGEDILAKYPNLIKVKNNVLSVPSVKDYIKKRKDNPMAPYDLKSEV